ncbi:ribonuclease HII [Salisediminibacterium halotolerans]|uniref:ribonuclease HII n=1 Tax=Salisediminibacterium halotolerans TaxID=517425 RepID=UPI000EAC8AE0|nr:ribonuclease HII [Salisediminibacterium halotolerans]RLJ74240.1 RNase HII [Actinophytocola xinjiangensis]RPE87668.1 RNase HII [Salisediminibacterium halotolerans]TWG35077.1 RNase HII [Salisediminibacterium halotolerans]GEL06875.1 ribonuclease HII [Salisediminibacterium halotolerans]
MASIKEIELRLNDIQTETDPRFIELLTDERKGVQQAVAKWRKRQTEKETLRKAFAEMTRHELKARDDGAVIIGGVDEVGRGPLAGPVVASCVVLPEGEEFLGLTDSKKLSETKREFYYEDIFTRATAVGIGEATAEEIDTHNIYEASKLAMVRAVSNTNAPLDFLLVDAMSLPLEMKQESLIKGDARSVSIAAASIVAKVTRDRYMKEIAKVYPGYGFDNHAGYGTAEHLQALKTFGVTDEHRRSFAPVRKHVTTT